MKRPRIGITCDVGKRNYPEEPKVRPRHVLMDAYVESVIKAGGAPLLLPAVEDEQASVALLTGIHGLIISGGGHDIDPMLYGEERLPECSPTNPKRETAEMAACRGAMSRDMPVLGICGGMQVINIAAGGTLYQDIPSQVPGALTHRPKNTDENTYTFHEIEIGDSILGEVLGTSSVVNSHHHQMRARLRVSAKTEDGVVEAREPLAPVRRGRADPESMAFCSPKWTGAAQLFSRFVDEARVYGDWKRKAGRGSFSPGYSFHSPAIHHDRNSRRQRQR